MRARNAHLHYKLIAALLYNEFGWIEKPTGGNDYQVIPTSKWCSHFKTHPKAVSAALTRAQDAGMIQRFSWHGHYFIVMPQPPRGFGAIASKVV